MLHSKKSESIVQWYNSLTTKGNVNSLEQFTDGSYFSRIVSILRGGSKEDILTAESVIFSETSIACNEEVVTSVEEQEADEKMETSVLDNVEADPFVIKESDLTDTQKTYDDIRKFIDEFYNLESFSLIDYGECMKGKELELAKVAVFLLSAMVQTFLSSQNELVYNTTLLEMEVQENIHECLALALNQQENQIKKAELHKVLSRAAVHKAGTPVRKSSRSTSDPNDASDSAKNVSKKRKERQSVIVYEDLQNSPLKTLLESPKIQYKAAIMKKESELKKLRSALHDEENKVTELTSEKQNLNDELEKKKKDLEFYKKELKSQREALYEQEDLRKKELDDLKIELENFRKLAKNNDEKIKELKKSNEAIQKQLEEKQKELEKTTSLVSENQELRDKIQFLDLDNYEKNEKIKSLETKLQSMQAQLHELQRFQELPSSREEKSEEIKILETKLKSVQAQLHELQRCQELPSSREKRRELRSSNVSDALSTIIYADEPSRETLGRKDQERPAEVKCVSTSEDISVASSESVFIDLISIQKESGAIKLSTEGGNNDSQVSANNSEHSLLNSEKHRNGRMIYIRRILNEIISKLSCKNAISPVLKDVLLAHCTKKDDPDYVAVLLRDLCLALDPPVSNGSSESNDIKKSSDSNNSQVSAVSTRSRSLAGEEKNVVNSFTSVKSIENKLHSTKMKNERRTKSNPDLQQELVEKLHEIAELKVENKALKHELKASKEIVEDLQRKVEDLQRKVEDLQREVDVLKAEAEGLKQKAIIAEDKYMNMEKLAKKKDDDVKKALIMYQRIVKLDKKESKKECGEECEKLRRRCKRLNELCFDFEKEAGELKGTIKHLEGMMEHLQFEIKELKKEKKELQHDLWKETAALSRNTTERDALVLHYLKKSKHEPKKIKNLEPEREDKKSSRPIVKVDAYILNSDNEPSMSNSVLASRSIRSSHFQVADEDDFLNESSLAEIHNGGIPEGESGENRLLELQRRNTLCPPHLQSSYPLEIQNMTPSERKYYNPGEVSFDLSRKRDVHNKPKSTCMENDSDEDDSHLYPVKKRKISEVDRISVPASKKQYRPSSSVGKVPSKDQGIPRKPSTPLKRVAAFVKRQSTTFITPSSVNRLMKLQRKNKIH